MSEGEIITRMQEFVDWIKLHKETTNKADELIAILQGMLDLYNNKKEVLQLTQSGLDEAKVVIQMMVEEIMIKRCCTYVSPDQWNSLKQEIVDGYFKNVSNGGKPNERD